jgi:signal transduction histidine kinase
MARKKREARTSGEPDSRTTYLEGLSHDVNNVLVGLDIPVVILEKDHRIRRFTPQAGKVLNLVAADVGRRIKDIRFNVGISGLDEMIGQAVHGRGIIKREIRDREGRWYLLRVLPYRTIDDTIDGSLLILFDIDEFKKAREELRSLLSRLTSVQESNNRMLARELHDEISPSLAALSLMVTTLAEHPPNSPDILRKSLRTLSDDIGKVAGDIHQLSRQLHPSILDDLGLPSALKAECGAFSKRHRTPCYFAAENVPNAIPQDVALCLYRVAQEALRNVGKHANAETVKMRLRGIDDGVELSITDKGDGFDLAKVRDSKGVGLVSMEERVRMVNGHFSITSQRAKGTSVVIRVPLRKGENEKANSAAGG